MGAMELALDCGETRAATKCLSALAYLYGVAVNMVPVGGWVPFLGTFFCGGSGSPRSSESPVGLRCWLNIFVLLYPCDVNPRCSGKLFCAKAIAWIIFGGELWSHVCEYDSVMVCGIV